MAEISKITLPSGTTYDIKDATARQSIAGGISFLGVSSSEITDGGTQKPTIDNTQVTPINGNLVIYGDAEFVYVGEYGGGGSWSEFGDLSDLGSLAYKNSASGTVAVPNTYTTTVTPSTTTKYVASSATGGGTATKGTVTVSPASSGTATYTPAGTISTGTGTANYTPAGSVTAPTISVGTAGSTTSIKAVDSGKTVVENVSVTAPTGTLPTGETELVYYSVSGETLTLSKFSSLRGISVITENVTVKTGDASYTASQPTFSGTGTELKFTGTGARLKTDSEVYTTVTMPSFSSQTIATGITSASTTTATTENKTVTVT